MTSFFSETKQTSQLVWRRFIRFGNLADLGNRSRMEQAKASPFVIDRWSGSICVLGLARFENLMRVRA